MIREKSYKIERNYEIVKTNEYWYLCLSYSHIHTPTPSYYQRHSHTTHQSWKVIEKLKVSNEKRNNFWKQKAKVKKKLKSWKPKFYLYHFFPPFHNCITRTTQKFHFESYNIGTLEIFGKKWEVESFEWKAKNFWKWKAKSKRGKNYWKAES